MRLAGLLKLRQQSPVALREIFLHATGARTLRLFAGALVLAGEEAAPQRAVWDHAHAVRTANHGQLTLILRAVYQRVMRLQAVVARQPQLVACPQSAHQLPRFVVGAAQVAHFAGSHQISQCTKRFRFRRLCIG